MNASRAPQRLQRGEQREVQHVALRLASPEATSPGRDVGEDALLLHAAGKGRVGEDSVEELAGILAVHRRGERVEVLDAGAVAGAIVELIAALGVPVVLVVHSMSAAFGYRERNRQTAQPDVSPVQPSPAALSSKLMAGWRLASPETLVSDLSPAN